MSNMAKIGLAIAGVVIVAGIIYATKQSSPTPNKPAVNNQQTGVQPKAVGITLTDGSNIITGVMPEQIVDLSTSTTPTKEISMNSFVDMVDGKPHPQYSIKEITVKKGDMVKINVTMTKGIHDFNLDEFNIHLKTPLNEQVTAEFKADKVGKFIYYCSMPNHRALGHWGVLNIVE